MRKILVFLLGFYSLAALASGELALSSMEGKPGDTIDVSITLSSSDAVSAVGIAIPLDDKLRYVPNSAALIQPRGVNHTINAQSANDTLFISIYSLSLATLSNETNALCSIRLIIGDEPTTYTIVPKVDVSNSQGQKIDVTIQGGQVTILAPKLLIKTSKIDFGHYPIRSTYTRTLTIQNTGTAELTIDSISLPSSAFSCPQQTWTIAAGQSQNISISYLPTVRGQFEGIIHVFSNAVNGQLREYSEATVIADPFSVNELHTSKASGISDSSVAISINVQNMEPLCGVQVSYKLPPQVEYVPQSATLSTRAQHMQVQTTQSNDTLTFVIYSLTNDTLLNNDGIVLTYKLNLVGAPGSYTLKPINVCLSNKAMENMTSATKSGSVSISAPAISANSSLTFAATSILEKPICEHKISNTSSSVALIVDRAVFLGEDSFEIVTPLPLTIQPRSNATIQVQHIPHQEGDFTSVMQLYTNDPKNRIFSVNISGKVYEPNTIALSGELAQGGYMVHLHLTNYSSVTGLQADFNWVDSLQAEVVGSDRLNGHTMQIINLGGGRYRLLVYSLSNALIQHNEGVVCSVLFKGIQPRLHQTRISMDSIYLSDALSNQRLTSNAPYWDVDLSCRISTQAINGDIEISPSSPDSIYVFGQELTIEAVPHNGFIFQQWNDGNTDNPRSLLVTKDETLIAAFASSTPTNINVINSLFFIQNSKFIRNGQLYILRDGKAYNAQGWDVR